MKLPKRKLLVDNREQRAMAAPGKKGVVLKGRSAGAHDLQSWLVIGLRLDGRHSVLDGAATEADARRKARRYRKYCKQYAQIVVECSAHTQEAERYRERLAIRKAEQNGSGGGNES